MASETDGSHQDDHKILGFVPYSTQRADASLRVTDDAFRALKAAGLPDLPEAHRRLPSYPVLRLIYPQRTEYCVQFDRGKKSAKDVADSFARGLTKAVRRSNPSIETVEGTCPDGKTHFSLFIDKGPSPAPVQIRIWPESAP